MKNMNELYNNKKSKKDLMIGLKREFTLATKDPEFIKLCNKLDVCEEVLCKYTSKLEGCVKELRNCKDCKGLGQCRNEVMGYVNYPIKSKDNNCLYFSYVACKYEKDNIKESSNAALYFEMPSFLKKAKMSDLFIDDKARVKILKYANLFINKFNSEEKMKGLYLHGSFGSGKSYIISALINELSLSGARGVVVYYPSLLRS